MATVEWAAGFIDGEGCLDIYESNRGQHQVRLKVGNTHLPALRALQELFPSGRIHSKKSKYENALPMYAIEWTGKKAVEPILKALVGFSIVKKEQIEFVLSTWMPQVKVQGQKLSEAELKTRVEIKETLSAMKRQAFLQ